MPKKTAKPVEQPELPAAKNGAVWSDEDRAAHYAKVEIAVGTAMKTIPLSGSAIDMLRWLKKNSSAGYKNLLRAAFQAAGL